MSQPDLRAFLRSLDSATLADLLCEQADRDPELRRRLLARAHGGELAEVSDLLDDARPAEEAVQVTSVLDTLQRLLDGGTQADVAPLACRAVDKITAALGDTEGAVGESQLERAVALYARACAAHPPPPSRLADWFLGMAFGTPGWPDISLPDFAEALGEQGIARVKSTVDKLLDVDDSGRRHTARRIQQEIAEVTGDVDTVVRILSEQLPRLDVSLKIVRVLRAAGRHADAIAHAARALGNDPAARRGSPVEELEGAHAARPVEPVAVLLADGRDEEAWKAASEQPPADMIAVYRRHIEELIARKDAAHYARAAAQLRRLRTLHRRAGTAGEFSEFVTDLAATHRRKTRLLEEIRRARIALPKTLR